MATYVPIIGMEVHVELKTNAKMFCACVNSPDNAEPNTHICPICTGHPGTLPVPNRRAIELGVLVGKALGCTIRAVSKFDRKHYFFPDLPKGYQISQYDEPIAEYGTITLTFPLDENIRETAKIGIRRAHLEEDTAKLFHIKNGDTLVDFNRAGVPLLEIVTDPDFKTPLEAKTYCQELRLLLRALNASDADMEKGHMRCEANISMQEAGRFEIVEGMVKPLASYTLNPKVELKNINSFRAIEKAIRFEIDRQTALLEKGETWVQQTRGWNDEKGETVLQRTKEQAADYRYFREPDIPPFEPLIIAGNISLPELPQAKRARFHDEYGFSYSDARILSEDPLLADFAEAVMSELAAWVPGKDENHQDEFAELAGGWITSKLLGALAEQGKTISEISFSAENFAELLSLIFTKKINSSNAQKLLSMMLRVTYDADPTHLMEEHKLGQVSDESAIEKIIDRVIEDNPKQVEEFRAGKEPVIKFLIGMGMRASEGAADPAVLEAMLRKKLFS